MSEIAQPKSLNKRLRGNSVVLQQKEAVGEESIFILKVCDLG